MLVWVARGGASRQGLKHRRRESQSISDWEWLVEGLPARDLNLEGEKASRYRIGSGSWRGFPPGIETASAVTGATPSCRGSWRGFPPGIETCHSRHAA